MRFVIMAFICLYAVCCRARCEFQSERVLFLGIPLGGNSEAFVDSLEKRGYVLQNETDICTSLTGMFDGVQCIVEVHATPRSRTVHQVSVTFAEFMENEVARMLMYRSIRSRLKRKYAHWDYRHGKSLDEWSSDDARISLGVRRLPGHSYKTLYVWWQDRVGWETLNKELSE